jgi:hypothetical protein
VVGASWPAGQVGRVVQVGCLGCLRRPICCRRLPRSRLSVLRLVRVVRLSFVLVVGGWSGWWLVLVGGWCWLVVGLVVLVWWYWSGGVVGLVVLVCWCWPGVVVGLVLVWCIGLVVLLVWWYWPGVVVGLVLVLVGLLVGWSRVGV